ncbi:MAG: hypothetical protein KDE27_05290, partial [Planctomycetes bacterium]|nr:hypothetical protein [Planctomycetota bacterium]
MRVHPNLTGMLLLVGLSGCHVTTVESRPLAGPTPQRVAVWPVADEPVLLAGLDDALRGRGYTIVSTAVARQLLADAALLPPDTRAPRGAEVSAVGAALGADALLELEVSRFEASAGEFREARWDLTWRLVAARDGAVVWDYEHAGA